MEGLKTQTFNITNKKKENNYKLMRQKRVNKIEPEGGLPRPVSPPQEPPRFIP